MCFFAHTCLFVIEQVRYSTRVSRRVSAMASGGGTRYVHTRLARPREVTNLLLRAPSDPRHPSYMKERIAAANADNLAPGPGPGKRKDSAHTGARFAFCAYILCVGAVDLLAPNRKSRRAAFQMSDEDRAAALDPDATLAQLDAPANRRSVVSWSRPAAGSQLHLPHARTTHKHFAHICTEASTACCVSLTRHFHTLFF